MSWRIVVLSPPGRISPLTPSRSAGRRTRTPSTPMARERVEVLAERPLEGEDADPHGARLAGASSVALPAADGEPLLLGDLLEGDAAHRGAQALARPRR